MQPIPQKHRKLIDQDTYYKSCVICGSREVEIHHVFIYSGRQISDMWNYQPVCRKHHAEGTPHNNKYKKTTRDKLELLCLERVDTMYLMANYPKRPWVQLKKYLWQEANL